MESDDPLVTAADVVDAGHCVVPGLRDWCKQHGFDLRTFVKVGYPESQLLATKDALAIRVVEIKRARNGR